MRLTCSAILYAYYGPLDHHADDYFPPMSMPPVWSAITATALEPLSNALVVAVVRVPCPLCPAVPVPMPCYVQRCRLALPIAILDVLEG